MGDDGSGHLVSGHVDGERKIKKNVKGPSGWIMEIRKFPEDRDLTVNKGSVAVDGVSLTVAEDNAEFFRIFLIPYTLGDTTLSEKKTGDYVNVEYDIIGKYADKKNRKVILTFDKLQEKGFI
jgi:riboflavin synthase